MWGPGRVIGINEDIVELRIFSHGDYGELSVLEMSLTISEVDVNSQKLEVGSYIEFGIGIDETIKIRAH